MRPRKATRCAAAVSSEHTLDVTVSASSQSTPLTGWMLAYEWAASVFAACLGVFLHLVYRRGQLTSARAPSFSFGSDGCDGWVGGGVGRRGLGVQSLRQENTTGLE